MPLKGLAGILAVSLFCLSLCYLAVLPPAIGEVAGPPATEAEKGHVDVPSTAYGHGGAVAEKEASSTYPGEAGKGVGPYGKYWDPIPTHKYWAPQYFYKPPSIPQGVFIEEGLRGVPFQVEAGRAVEREIRERPQGRGAFLAISLETGFTRGLETGGMGGFLPSLKKVGDGWIIC